MPCQHLNFFRKINFIILKEKTKENLNKKKNHIPLKKKKKKEQKNLNPKEQ